MSCRGSAQLRAGEAQGSGRVHLLDDCCALPPVGGHPCQIELRPTARDTLRCVLILDQPDRDAIASELLRYRSANGDDWADVVDTLTMRPDTRRKVVRLLAAEIDAASSRNEMSANRGGPKCVRSLYRHG